MMKFGRLRRILLPSDFTLLPGQVITANAASGVENNPRNISVLAGNMLLAIARDLVPLRTDRVELRVRKRRPKNFRLITGPREKFGQLPHGKVGRENLPKSPLS